MEVEDAKDEDRGDGGYEDDETEAAAAAVGSLDLDLEPKRSVMHHRVSIAAAQFIVSYFCLPLFRGFAYFLSVI
jgi:hypothetical protein